MGRRWMGLSLMPSQHADFPAWASFPPISCRSSGAVSPIRVFQMPLILQLEPVCPRLGCDGAAVVLLPQTGNFSGCGVVLLHPCLCCRRRWARHKSLWAEDFGISAFSCYRPWSLLPLSFLSLAVLFQPSPCCWFLACLQLFPVPSPLMQPRKKTPNPQHAWC